MPDISPFKKGNSAFDAKNKGLMSSLEEKKKAKASPSKVTTVVATGEGTLSILGAVLGAMASILLP